MPNSMARRTTIGVQSSSRIDSKSATVVHDDKVDGDDSVHGRGSSAKSMTATYPKYIRWKPQTQQQQEGRSSSSPGETGGGCEMQTAVTTFTRQTASGTTQTVELHAQLHFGDREYFDYYRSEAFYSRHDRVLYELLVNEDLLTSSSLSSSLLGRQHGGLFRALSPRADGQSPVVASASDQATARRYGLSCQVNVMDYTQPRWIHADLTRQEFLQQLREQQRDVVGVDDNSRPLWQMASNNASPVLRVATEAAAALLVGPPAAVVVSTEDSSSGSSSSVRRRRRLFSNLFLPGDALARALRMMLWLTPSPEISILLLDWSSLLTLQGDGRGGLSKITLPLLEAVLMGRLDLVRKLIFGQIVLMSSSTSTSSSQQGQRQSNYKKSTNDGTDLLVFQRNQRAVQVLKQVLALQLEGDGDKSSKDTRTALLYGSSHCPDLHVRLRKLGFVPTQTTWRTAWSVPLAAAAADDKRQPAATASAARAAVNADNPFLDWSQTTALALLTIVPLYLIVGGMDWIATLGNAVQKSCAMVQDGSSGMEHAAGDVLLYLARHLALYVALSKIVVDWGGGGGTTTSAGEPDTTSTRTLRNGIDE